MTNNIIGPFSGEYRWLSNFAKLDEPIIVGGFAFWHTENLYQGMKCAKPDDFGYFSSCTPAEAKRKGRIIEIDPDWDDTKLTVMGQCQEYKFSQPRFKALLLETNQSDLVEINNWHDNYWGDCKCNACENIVGQNHLGKIIMTIRNFYSN